MQRPRAAGDEHRLDRVVEPELARVEARAPPRAARARRPTADSSCAPPRARSRCRRAARPGRGTARGSKSPTVRLQTGFAACAFSARISAAMRRISEPITPRARSPSDASTRAGSPSLPLRSIEPLSYNRSHAHRPANRDRGVMARAPRRNAKRGEARRSPGDRSWHVVYSNPGHASPNLTSLSFSPSSSSQPPRVAPARAEWRSSLRRPRAREPPTHRHATRSARSPRPTSSSSTATRCSTRCRRAGTRQHRRRRRRRAR